MQTVSATYTTILSGRHRAEWAVRINNVYYAPSMIESISITAGAFPSSSPAVGSCVSAEIDITMKKPAESIPRMALIEAFVRLKNDSLTSEWLRKGYYYIDTRQTTKNGGVERLTIHGYDAMLKAEQDCPISGFPKTDLQTVQQIASTLGVTLDSSVSSQINKGYTIQTPAEYSCREVLGYIAAAYAGCFVMDDFGKLRLIQINGYPAETNLLINTAGLYITFGGDRIIV